MRSLLHLDSSTYVPHPLHRLDRVWSETNCYVDLWIELLHALDLDPLAAAAFTLAGDFDGSQWTFFKYPIDDLRRAYGIEVAEMNVWRTVEEHLVEQLERGRFLTIEVDSWFLPDTAGVAYRVDHAKTTIVPNAYDPDGRTLGYFHNRGYHELAGDDFDGVLRRDPPPGSALDPYVELVRLDGRLDLSADDLTAVAVELARHHLARRPRRNPVTEMAERLVADIPWLQGQDLDTFHRWAFGTCRQCGSCAEVAAAFAEWLDERADFGLAPAVQDLREVAEEAKALQFQMARMARGRAGDLAPLTEAMAGRWEHALDLIEARVGP